MWIKNITWSSPSCSSLCLILFSWATQAGNNRQTQSGCICNLREIVVYSWWRLCVNSVRICIMQPSELSHASVFLQLYLLHSAIPVPIRNALAHTNGELFDRSLTHWFRKQTNKLELKWECVWGQTGWMKRTKKQVTAIVSHYITGWQCWWP